MDVMLSPKPTPGGSRGDDGTVCIGLTPIFEGGDAPRDALLLDWMSHAVGRKIARGQSIFVHVGLSEVYRIIYNDDENGLAIVDPEVLIDRFVRHSPNVSVVTAAAAAVTDNNAFKFRVDPKNDIVAFADSTLRDAPLRRRLIELCARPRYKTYEP